VLLCYCMMSKWSTAAGSQYGTGHYFFHRPTVVQYRLTGSSAHRLAANKKCSTRSYNYKNCSYIVLFKKKMLKFILIQRERVPFLRSSSRMSLFLILFFRAIDLPPFLYRLRFRKCAASPVPFYNAYYYCSSLKTLN